MDHNSSFGEMLMTIIVASITGVTIYIIGNLIYNSINNSTLTYSQTENVAVIIDQHPELKPMVEKANEDYISVGEYRKLLDKRDELIIRKALGQ